MAKRNTSININGKRYDALTGNLLKHPTVQRKTSRSIDGVVGGAPKKAAPAAPVTTPSKTLKPLAASSVPRSTAPHAKSHTVAPSKTLMRHAVQKPASQSLKRRVKVQATTAVVAPASIGSQPSVIHKTYFHQVNNSRLARASQTNTSPKVARFAHELSNAMPIAFKEAVAEADKQFVVPATVAPRVVHAYRPDVSSGRQPGKVTNDIFAQALARATSHEELAPETPGSKSKRRRTAALLRRRMISYGTGALAVLLIVGYLGYHNVDNVKYKMAANKAGFAASVPSYKPKGFDISKVSTTPGSFSVYYSSKTTTSDSGRSFALTEKPSSWSSDTLLTNITSDSDQVAYSTLQAAGRTVFVYGKNQAAWVSNGVLYQVLGNGALSTHDFTSIAASL